MTIALHDITGLVLAGGRGSRMGGLDKGLQAFCGQPLAQHAAQRLQPQVGAVLINANRHLDRYRAWGWPVVSDAAADYPGPLAGFWAGLQACCTPYLVTVPCDSPLFPLNLVARLAAALEQADAEVAMVAAPEEDEAPTTPPHIPSSAPLTRLRPQPVFCLMRQDVLGSLQIFMATGRRRIDAWTATLNTVTVPFNAPTDDPLSFANANTLADLAVLQRHMAPRHDGA